MSATMVPETEFAMDCTDTGFVDSNDVETPNSSGQVEADDTAIAVTAWPTSMEDGDTAESASASQLVPPVIPPPEPAAAAFQMGRFLAGLLLTTLGMATVLAVGIGLFELRQFGGDLVLLLVGLCVILGVMMLGGGFGLMATASQKDPEADFERMMRGEISATAPPIVNTPFDATLPEDDEGR
ncbi:MAG: hypothetical protein KDA85_18940 [Planctomycetaceae bacterium]|nr:hypothetical protein [Planctomycetaceae bacterium]